MFTKNRLYENLSGLINLSCVTHIPLGSQHFLLSTSLCKRVRANPWLFKFAQSARYPIIVLE
jgi:hypothetical protein